MDTVGLFQLFHDNCVTRLHSTLADAGYQLSDTTPVLPTDLFRMALTSRYAVLPVRVYVAEHSRATRSGA